MTPQLIALDIDGTLLRPGVGPTALPDPELTLVIHQLMAAGIACVLATGRMYPGTQRIARHLGIELPLICQQGASTHKLDGKLQRTFSIDPSVALLLVDYATTQGWPYAWFDSERYLVSQDNAQCREFAAVSGIVVEQTAKPHCTGLVATGVDIISTVDHSDAIHDHLAGRHGEEIQLVNFPSVTAAYAPQATKGHALQKLAQDYSIPQAAVLAIGDSVNDVSMLRWAGMSAAPAHCDVYARAAAKEILPGVGVSGVLGRLRAVLA